MFCFLATGHKLNRIGNCHYEYDNAGRLIEKTEHRDGFRHKTTYFHWNGNNQLESLTNAQGEVWYYKYDALGRRIEKVCPERHVRIGYVWDGDQIAYQYTEKQGKRESHRHSVFNGWELIAQQDCYFKHDLRTNEKTWTEETHYAVSQPNGQVLALFNPQGKRVWRKQPTSIWGLPLLSSWERKQQEPINPNLLFAGQYFDDESGLAYNRFRYYDPESGNYLTSDPIGLQGGETPYSYVHNALDFLDPFGLAVCGVGSGGKGLFGHQAVDRVAAELDTAVQRATKLLDRGSDMGTTWGKIYQKWAGSPYTPQWLKNVAKGNAIQQITDKLTRNNRYLNELGIIRNKTGIWGKLRPDYHAILPNGKVAVFDITTAGQAPKISKYNIDKVTSYLINILY